MRPDFDPAARSPRASDGLSREARAPPQERRRPDQASRPAAGSLLHPLSGRIAPIPDTTAQKRITVGRQPSATVLEILKGERVASRRHPPSPGQVQPQRHDPLHLVTSGNRVTGFVDHGEIEIDKSLIANGTLPTTAGKTNRSFVCGESAPASSPRWLSEPGAPDMESSPPILRGIGQSRGTCSATLAAMHAYPCFGNDNSPMHIRRSLTPWPGRCRKALMSREMRIERHLPRHPPFRKCSKPPGPATRSPDDVSGTNPARGRGQPGDVLAVE